MILRFEFPLVLVQFRESLRAILAGQFLVVLMKSGRTKNIDTFAIFEFSGARVWFLQEEPEIYEPPWFLLLAVLVIMSGVYLPPFLSRP